MKETNPRLLLARLRSGNYAHPGDTEAIDIFLHHLNRHQRTLPSRILDVGCGRGGTADYIRSKSMNLSITGIDIDERAIADAKRAYPDIEFTMCDVAHVEQFVRKPFDLIYMFSVFYAFPTFLKQDALNKLASIAHEGSILAISDYIRLNEDVASTNDFAGKPMEPMCIEDISIWLHSAGWEMIEFIDLNDHYQRWYRDFLKKLNQKRMELLLEFAEHTIDEVIATFQAILERIDAKIWGGGIIYARLNQDFRDRK